MSPAAYTSGAYVRRRTKRAPITPQGNAGASVHHFLVRAFGRLHDENLHGMHDADCVHVQRPSSSYRGNLDQQLLASLPKIHFV